MSYIQEERLFKEEAVLEEMWGNPIVLIYPTCIKVFPYKNREDYYIPFVYKNKTVLIEQSIE